MVKTHTR